MKDYYMSGQEKNRDYYMSLTVSLILKKLLPWREKTDWTGQEENW